MKINLLILLPISALVFTFCGKPSSKEFMAEFGKEMCYKVADCSSEQIKDLPEEQKKMAMAMIPQRKDCDNPESKFRKEFHKETDGDKKELSSDQIEKGKKCLEAFKKASCSAMGSAPIPECDAFEKATAGM